MSFNFIACSDLHITKNKPSSRKDIYFSSVKRKINWLFSTAAKYKAHIICGGDVFENVSVSHNTIKEIISIAKKYKDVKFYTVYGQHDLRYHVYSSNDNTPLAILLTALGTTHLDTTKIELDDIVIQGASWGQPIPPIAEGKINILATHRMVTLNPLWPGHTDYTTPQEFIDAGYDITVSGDNHKSFIYENKGKLVVNSGSLVRSRIDQLHYTPRVFLVSIDSNRKITYQPLDVPIRTSDAVFNAEKIEEYNQKLVEVKEQLNNFTEKLNDYILEKPDYMYNLIKIKDNITDNQGIVNCLNNIIERVKNKKYGK